MAFTPNRVIRYWPRLCLVLTLVVHFCLIEVNGNPLLNISLNGGQKETKSKGQKKLLGDVGSLLGGELTQTDKLLKEHQDQLQKLQKKLKTKGLNKDLGKELELEQERLNKEKAQLEYTQPHGKKDAKKVGDLKKELIKKQKGLDLLKDLQKKNQLSQLLGLKVVSTTRVAEDKNVNKTVEKAVESPEVPEKPKTPKKAKIGKRKKKKIVRKLTDEEATQLDKTVGDI